MLAGVVAGLAGCAVVVPLVRSQLYDVEPFDPAALIGATALLSAVALPPPVCPPSVRRPSTR